MATMDESTIALCCEMRAFIRPDSSLIWEGPGGQRISGGTGKHQITFSDGSPNAAANGFVLLVPSRVSTLTITNPEPSDAGTYTCSVMGTSEAVTIELDTNILTTDLDINTTDVNSVDVNSTDCPHTEKIFTTSLTHNVNGTPQPIVIILGSTTALMMGLLFITAIALCYVAMHTRAKLKSDAKSNPVNVEYHGMTIDSEVNEAYGVAIDGIGIDSMKRNIAYDAVTYNSAGDADAMVDDR